ncbi:MAG: hypothetical protein IKT52_05780 [Oscillospiraceae bacterium]|nr:hypothetical protein [Oscillospiraceae bacterium]
MKSSVFNWHEDKLKTVLIVSWLLTVFSSFLGIVISFGYLPGIGSMFPFRIFLPVSAVLYLVWIIRRKHNPWKHASYVLRVCYILCVLLVLHGAFSLFHAIDFAFTFRRFFNLCFDLCFFYLALELCKDKCVLLYSIRCSIPALLIQIALGVVEVFSGGVFFECRDNNHDIHFLGKVCHWPHGTLENPNDYAMLLVLALALLLMYWGSRHHEEKCDWIPVVIIAPVYFLLYAGEARLCLAAFFVLMIGFIVYALTLERKKGWVLALSILLFGLITFGYNHELMTDQTLNAVESIAVTAEAAPLEAEQTVMLAVPSMKDRFFVVDGQTGELHINQRRSDGIRLYLLVHALDCFMQSKGMGVGLGNAEQLARISTENVSGIWNIHCFLARMIADFGIWFLIPLLLIIFELLRMCFKGMYQGFKEKKISDAMRWFLYLSVLIGYPIASTAPAEAQDILVMWLFLAGIIWFPMHMQKAEKK